MTATDTPAGVARATAAVESVIRRESYPPRLAEQVYLRTQKIYEAHSDQRVRIAQWLCEAVRRFTEGADALRVLSIGCGDGTLDVALAQSLVERGVRGEYTGIEPSAWAGELFLERLAPLPRVHAGLIRTTLESARLADGHDVIVAIHSLYYVRELPHHLRRLIAALRPGGKLIILNAPLAGINELVEAVAPPSGGASLTYSDVIADLLQQIGHPVTRHRIDAALDISPCRDPRSDVGLDILQFLAHADLGAASPKMLGALVGYLREIAVPPGGSLVPHPVDALVVDNRA